MFKHVGAPTTSRRKRNAKGYDASSTDTLASLAARTRKELHAYLPSISFSLPLGFVGRKVDSSEKTQTGHTDRHADRNTEATKSHAHLLCCRVCLPVVACGRDLKARDKLNDAVRCRRYGLCAASVRGAPS